MHPGPFIPVRVTCTLPHSPPQEGAELYLIPAMDQLNHSTELSLRNTTLLRCNTPMAVEVGAQYQTLQ